MAAVKVKPNAIAIAVAMAKLVGEIVKRCFRLSNIGTKPTLHSISAPLEKIVPLPVQFYQESHHPIGSCGH